ncbi:Tetratricopeptide repeat-like superfamily protein, partial [Prunus dulcis]
QPKSNQGSSSQTLLHQIVTLKGSVFEALRLVPKLMNFGGEWLGLPATRDALFRRHLGTSPLCPICGEFPESVEHLFLLCNWVQPVWFGGPLNYRINRQSITSMSEWMMQILKISQSLDMIGMCPHRTLLVAKNLINDFNLVRCPPGDAFWRRILMMAKGTLQAGLGVVVRNSASNFMVPRGANRAADAAAQRARRRMCDEVWASSPPSSLVFVLQADGLPCPRRYFNYLPKAKQGYCNQLEIHEVQKERQSKCKLYHRTGRKGYLGVAEDLDEKNVLEKGEEVDRALLWKYACEDKIGKIVDEESTDSVTIEEKDRLIEEQLTQDHNDVEGLRSLMEVRIKAHKLTEAIQVLDRLIELEPEEYEWQLLKANVHSYMGEFELATSLSWSFDVSVSQSAEKLENVVKRVEEAMEGCKKQENESDVRDFKLLIAQIRVMDSNYSEALKLYQELNKEAGKQFEKFRKLVPKNHPYKEYFMTICSS